MKTQVAARNLTGSSLFALMLAGLIGTASAQNATFGVVVLRPADGAVISNPPPVNVSLVAAAWDAAGPVASVQFFADNVSLGFGVKRAVATNPTNIFELVWSNAPVGVHVITAVAAGSSGITAASPPVKITILPRPPVPPPVIVTVRATDPYASEICGAIAIIDSGKFTFRRNGGTNFSMKVYYSISGTASNGIDYAKLSGVVEFATNQWSVDVYVAPFCDNLVEGTESVGVRLEPIACVAIWPPPPDCYLVGQPAEAVVYIRDWARPPIVRILEPTNGAAFRFPADVKIIADAVDPDGYIHSLYIYEGTNVIGGETRYYYVAPTNGTPFQFGMTWSNVPPGRHTIIARATGSRGDVGASAPVSFLVGWPPPVTNPPPVVTVVATDPVAIEGTNCWGWPTATNRWPIGTTNYCGFSPTANTLCWWFTNCGPKNATFVVRRAGATNDELLVKYELGGTAVNGIDYDRLPGSVTIPAGERRAPILIVPKSDGHPDPIKTVILRLVPTLQSSDVPPLYLVGYPNRAGAIIVDSDRPWPRPRILPDRCFFVGKEAVDGAWFRIEYSDDLRNWTAVCTGQAIQGAVYFVDPEAQDSTTRFYRAVPEPAAPLD